MAKWTDYTTDTEPTDNDEVMTLDADKSLKANKRVALSTLADYFLDKLADKVFNKLETNNQTVISAINELNSKAQFGTTTDIEVAANSIQTIDVTFKKAFQSVPTVVCSIRSGTTNPVYGSLNAFVDYSSITKTGFTIKVANSAASSTTLKPTISWIAMT